MNIIVILRFDKNNRNINNTIASKMVTLFDVKGLLAVLSTFLSNLISTRSLIIHPASTIHRQLTKKQLIKADLALNVVRLSIGIEDPTDLINDLKQALEKVNRKNKT